MKLFWEQVGGPSASSFRPFLHLVGDSLDDRLRLLMLMLMLPHPLPLFLLSNSVRLLAPKEFGECVLQCVHVVLLQVIDV